MPRGRVARNLTGTVFGKLTVIEDAGRNGCGALLCKCRCECGNEKILPRSSLVSGDTTSCGCFRREGKHSLLGQVFGKLTAVRYAGSRSGNGGARWVCRCECGREVACAANNLRRGRKTHCGCSRKEKLSRTPEWYSWASMISRCYYLKDKEYARYGGKSVVVCERWKTFVNFLADMGKRPSPTHSLDRFPDGKGNYEPGNCRWATPKQQAKNRTSSRPITIGGVTRSIHEWSEASGVKYQTIWSRLQEGLSGEELLRPAHPKNRRRLFMAVDKNHCDLRVGETACVCVVVKEVRPEEDGPNVTLETCEPMPPGTDKTALELNCRQVMRCCPCPMEPDAAPQGLYTGPHEDLWPYPGSLPQNMVMRLLDWLRGGGIEPKEAAHLAWHFTGFGLGQWDFHPPVAATAEGDLADELDKWSKNPKEKVPYEVLKGMLAKLATFCLLAALLFCASPARAQGWVFEVPTNFKATWTFDRCDCVNTGVCICDPGTCNCGPGCPQHCSEHKAKKKSSYHDMRAKVARGARGMVWVGGVCGPCVSELTDCLHCSVDSFRGVDEVGAVLIEGDGNEAYVVKTWNGQFPSTGEVRASSLARARVSYQPTYQPTYLAGPAYVSMPPAFGFGSPYGGFRGSFSGGFSGGCSGGGCSGGRCR